MRKWNWLRSLRCLTGGTVLLAGGAAFAGDASVISDVANPDKVFQQTSYNVTEEIGCGPKCGADAGCRSDGCDGGGLFGMCCNQDPIKLFEGTDVGGWASIGYSSAPTAFNNGFQDNRFLLNQGWIYLDKAATSECGEWGFGYHADFVYGADGTNTNSFGNSGGQFDTDPGFLHGDRAAWAIPQLYVEATNGDWTIKAGHFYTLQGYEVVGATGNFFYTHSYTMNYSEPFTHTGAIVSHAVSDNTEVFAGWTMGWDTGFNDGNNGSNFLGGFTTSVTDDLTFTYMTTFGDFGVGPGTNGVARGDGSYAHSVVVDYQINDRWNYVVASDYLRDGGDNDNLSFVNYLFYQVTDCVKAGTRAEWWKDNGNSHYETTFGLNVKPHANVTVRPEYRYDWSPAGNTNAGRNGNPGRVDQSQGTAAIDVVITF